MVEILDVSDLFTVVNLKKTSPLLDDLIKSDIVVSVSKEIVSNESKNTLGLMGLDKIDLSKNRFQ
jgi:hypothetical protein